MNLLGLLFRNFRRTYIIAFAMSVFVLIIKESHPPPKAGRDPYFFNSPFNPCPITKLPTRH